MKNSLLQRAAQLYHTLQRQRLWYRVVTGMACVVAIGTAYALVLPAITMELQPLCGQEEHIHEESCYETREVWSCLQDQGHTHGESCYETAHTLICGEAETGHLHDASCITRVRGELLCTEEESAGHTHGEGCYETTSTLLCTEEEYEGHAHGAGCYTAERVLTCPDTGEEHTHGESCYETRETLTCSQAESAGHTHGAGCYETTSTLLCTEEESAGHTHGDDCYVCTEEVTCGREENAEGHIHGEACYTTEKRLICGEELPPHTHDETCTMEAETVLICEKQEHTHTEACRLGEEPGKTPAVYGKLSALPETAVQLFAESKEGGPHQFFYEDSTVSMVIQLTGEPTLAGAREELPTEETAEEPLTEQGEEVPPAESEAEEPATETAGESLAEERASSDKGTGLVLAVIPQEEDSELCLDAEAYEATRDGEVSLVVGYEFCFFRDGREVDVSGCDITVELRAKDGEEEPAPMALQNPSETAAPMALRAAPLVEESEQSPEEEGTDEPPTEEEGNTTLRLSVLQDTEEGITETDSTQIDGGNPAGAVVRFSLRSSRMAVTLSLTANPAFTVEYYAYLEQVQLHDSGTLAVIDTDHGGANSGGNLPQNGVTPTLKYLNLTDGKLSSATSLEQIYRDYSYQYAEANTLAHINRLYKNGNYTLKEVWVRDADDTDWVTYEDPDTLQFTNRASSADATTACIGDGSHIRLVYDTVAGSYDNAANFYDYDITNGSPTKLNSTVWTNTTLFHTSQAGINSAGNYGTSGTKLAFGNSNTGTGLGTLVWNGNYLNQYNRSSYSGCTFGLASGLGADGTIRFADGIVAPNLFHEGAATGKTAFHNSELTFRRSGDAYTLVSVSGQSGIGADGLDSFSNPNGEGYTNLFWPMDGVTSGADPLFGDPIHAFYRAGGTAAKGDPLYAYAVSQYGTPSSTLPRADDGRDHNNYFGMNYAVTFNLTADYVGPLNYLFFGDDDMWVFLTDAQGVSRLVCDIGGVHSSVGEYVNLWDYIQKDGRTADAAYTLSFFYTERGASGSSCYMQFTLPSVSSATPSQSTGSLRIEKKVEGTDNCEEAFSFELSLTDDSDNLLRDDYSATHYAKDGTVIESNLLLSDGSTFSLQDGEYVVIRYLPLGTNYTVTEQRAAGYGASYSINGGEGVIGDTAASQILLSGTERVVFTNTARCELPATGGAGTAAYTMGGLCLTACGLLLLCRTRKKGGRATPC